MECINLGVVTLIVAGPVGMNCSSVNIKPSSVEAPLHFFCSCEI